MDIGLSRQPRAQGRTPYIIGKTRHGEEGPENPESQSTEYAERSTGCRTEVVLHSVLRTRYSGLSHFATAATPASLRRTAALSVRSQLNVGSSRPKCPCRAVSW